MQTYISHAIYPLALHCLNHILNFSSHQGAHRLFLVIFIFVTEGRDRLDMIVQLKVHYCI